MPRCTRFCLSALGALILFATPLAAQTRSCAGLERLRRGELVRILRRDGFSGFSDRATSIWYLGCAGEPGSELGIYLVDRVWGQARRLTRRLVFISRARVYLGMYAVADPPARIEPARIVFSYGSDGNEIVLEGGKLPEHVLLDGEPLALFK